MLARDAGQGVDIDQGGIPDGQLHAVVAPRRDPGDVGLEVALEGDGFELSLMGRQDEAEFHGTPPPVWYGDEATGQ